LVTTKVKAKLFDDNILRGAPSALILLKGMSPDRDKYVPGAKYGVGSPKNPLYPFRQTTLAEGCL